MLRSSLSSRCHHSSSSTRIRLPELVSFKAAAGLRQAPRDTVGKPPSEVPPHLLQCYVVPEVVSPSEEAALLAFSNPWFDRLPYVGGHVDHLIHHYKEFYRPLDQILETEVHFPATITTKSPSTAHTSSLSSSSSSSDVNTSTAVRENSPMIPRADMVKQVREALCRCRDLAMEYLPHIPLQNRVHFLQLTSSGFIRAHVDESRNSSGIVAGLTLGSGRVMSLTCPKFPDARVDLLLAPRSFYLLCGAARHEWEHSVDWIGDDAEHLRRMREEHTCEGEEVMFDGQPTGLRRSTRTAIIFRGVSPMELLMQRMGTTHRHA